MSRGYLPLKAAALMAAGFLLSGGGVAVAAPDSNSDKGGGKPSSAASGKAGSNPGKSGSAPGNSGSNPGKSGSTPGGNSGSTPGNSGSTPGGNSGSAPGKPATTPAGGSPGTPKSGTKTLPDTASPAAVAATGKTNPASTGTPNSFGQSVAAAVPTAAPSTVTVTPAATYPTAPGSSARSGDPIPTPPRVDRDGVTPPAPARRVGPSQTAGPEARQGAAAPSSPTAPTAAALSIPQPRSTGDAISPAADTGEGSWLGRAAGHLVAEVREALRQVTLKDLALAALPGLAGILFFFMTGIGIGHRQARFGFALEPTGAMRFAIGGPLGVVRPGGFVSVPTRSGKRRDAVSRRRKSASLNRAA